MIELKEGELYQYQKIEFMLDGKKIGYAEVDVKTKRVTMFRLFPWYQDKGYEEEVIAMMSKEYRCGCLW